MTIQEKLYNGFGALLVCPNVSFMQINGIVCFVSYMIQESGCIVHLSGVHPPCTSSYMRLVRPICVRLLFLFFARAFSFQSYTSIDLLYDSS